MNPPQTYRFYLQQRYGPNICFLFRNLENKFKKLQHAENSLTFLCRCREKDIVPKGFRLKPPFRSLRSERILKRTSLALLRERIQFHRHEKWTLTEEIQNLKNEIQENVSFFDYSHIIDCAYNSYLFHFNNQKLIHINKFQNLVNEKLENELTFNTNYDLIERTVINMSNKVLTVPEKSILSKGLNFSLPPKNFNRLDFVTGIEQATQSLPEETASEFRIRSKLILQKPFKIKSNITKEEKNALISLKTDNSIKILPADKGNATVVVDNNTYNEKIQTLLNEGSYSKLNKDPTKTIERKVYSTLYKYKRCFNDLERSELTPHYSKPPHFYGLPKIHKRNIPFRPIVSSINSPCHKLAKYLLNILNPLVGNTNSFIKNSQHFLEKLSEVNFNSGHLMVSFDVVSLFTNVPVDKSLSIIRNRLENDQNLKERTNLSVNAILELLTLCIKTTYFQYGNDFFQQDFGMAMGSPLSPLMSNIFMEDFENRILDEFNFKPVIWLRYIDDIFSIWPHDINKLYEFLNFLNNKEPTIKFTLEIEKDNKIPFLDVLIEKENTIHTSVYRKPTHTNRYLNFNSNHSSSVKKAVIKSLYDRAKIICSDNNTFLHEKEFIKEILIKNSYPNRFIENSFRQIEFPRERRNINNIQQETNLIIPFIPGISDKIKRIAKNYNIRTIFKKSNTLRSILTKTKPINEEQNTKNLIYKIPCECGKFYIGETSRPLEVRINEHKGYLRRGDWEKSRICQHSFENDHRVMWGETSILQKEPDKIKRKIKESACIYLNEDQCIANISVDINHVWLPILKQDLQKGFFKVK